jgi:diguanylate cyclase (GGDEF)-like protein/PAS domain S-box-containing protein
MIRLFTWFYMAVLFSCGFSVAAHATSNSYGTTVKALSPVIQLKKDTLIVGSEQDYPPFATGMTESTAGGFTVELWQAVAAEADLKYTLRVRPFHQILQEFKDGKIDVLINLAQSHERHQFADFSTPHVVVHGAIFVRKSESSISTEDDLSDKSIIVINGDLAHDYAAAKGLGKNLVPVDTAAEGFRLLASGKHDAMLISKLVGMQTLQALGLENIKALKAKAGFSQKFAFAVPEGQSELLAKINEGLSLTKSEGTYNKLYEKWFGIFESKSVGLTDLLKYLIPIVFVFLAIAGYFFYQRKIEREQAEAKFRTLYIAIEQSPASVVITNLEACIQYSNPQFTSTTGYSANEVLGKNPRILGSGQTSKETYDELWGNLTCGLAWKGELQNKRKNGELYWEEAHISPVKTPAGIITHYVAVNIDITERKQFEFKIQSSETLLRSMLESTDEGILMIAQDGRVISFNERFIELWHVPKEVAESRHDSELLAHVLNQLINPEDFKSLVRQLYESDEEARDILYFKDGRVFARFTRALLIGNERGRIWCFKDITEFRKVEHSLRESEQRLQEIIDILPVSLFIKDPSSKIVLMNHACERQWGMRLADLLGTDGSQFFPSYQMTSFLEKDREVFSNRTQINFEETVWDASLTGNRINHTFKKPVFDEAGKPKYLIGVSIDVTERKQADAERDLLLRIIEEAPDFIATSDMQSNLLFLNKAGARLVGLPENVGLSSLQIKDMHPDWATKRVLEEGIPAVLKQGHWHGETALRNSQNGHITPVSQLLLVHRDANGEPKILSTIMRDISDQKAYEKHILESEQYLLEILKLSPIAVRIAVKHGHQVVFSNQRYAELIKSHLPEGDDPGNYYAHPSDYEGILETIDHGEAVFNLEVELSIPGGLTVWALASYMPMQYQGEDAVLGWFYDITERKLIEDQVQQLAFYDALTGLPNRRLLDDRLSQAISACKRNDCYGALMYLDLDNFKPLNDSHGHQVGDLLLIEVAARLKACVREMDTVSRMGGDEFVVILSALSTDESASVSEAGSVAEKILKSLSEPYRLVNHHDGQPDTLIEHLCTASIGVVLFYNHEPGQDELLIWADEAMYQSKDAGRNQIRFYESKV